MKKNVVLRLFLLALPLSVFLSCTDHLSPENLPNNQRIKSITRILPEDGEIKNVTEFIYGQNGSLEGLKSYQTPDSNVAIRGHSVLQNADGKLTSLTRKLTNSSEERYTLAYDPSGKVVTLDYDAGNSDVYKMLFDYTGNQLKSSKRKFSFSSVSYEQDLTYTFNGDNLSSVNSTTTFVKNVPATSTSSSDFTYDDKINPFYGAIIIPAPDAIARPTQGNFHNYTYFGGLDNLLHLSKNNVLSEKTSANTETSYTYTYNSDGLPASRAAMRKNTPQDDSVLVETLQFMYETY